MTLLLPKMCLFTNCSSHNACITVNLYIEPDGAKHIQNKKGHYSFVGLQERITHMKIRIVTLLIFLTGFCLLFCNTQLMHAASITLARHTPEYRGRPLRLIENTYLAASKQNIIEYL